MIYTNVEMDERLMGLLNRLRPTPPLSQQIVAAERAKFLAQGETFRVALPQQARRQHTGWIDAFVFTFQSKQRIPILNALMAVIVITLLFGSAGAVAYAAQDSLPGEPLYPVKSWGEDLGISLAGSLQGQLNLTLEYTNRRMAEIAVLQTITYPLPEAATVRMRQELDAALQIAAQMEEPLMVQSLAQIRQQAETQSQTMSAWIGSGSGQNDPQLARLQERLQEQVRLASAGETDPQGFRQQMQERQRYQQNMPSQTPTLTPPGAAVYGPSGTPVPTGNSYGPGGIQTDGTPGHYGPGEPNLSQTPVATGGSYGPEGTPPGQISVTPAGYGPGPTAQSPNGTQSPGSPGTGSNKSTATPKQGGDPGGGQPTEKPGKGGGGPP